MPVKTRKPGSGRTEVRAIPRETMAASPTVSGLQGGACTLSAQVYETMKEDIVTGVLRPGDSVVENDLAARYRVSRTPIREAAVRLQQQGLMQIVPNRGYFVSQLTIRELREIYEYRAAVECACAELAACGGLSAAAFGALEEFIRQRHQGDNRSAYAQFIKADTAFHIGIARLTQNRLLVRAVADMRCHMERILYLAIDVIDKGYYQELPAREHEQILQAIKGGDAQLARRLMYDHIVVAKDKILELASRGYRLI